LHATQTTPSSDEGTAAHTLAQILVRDMSAAWAAASPVRYYLARRHGLSPAGSPDMILESPTPAKTKFCAYGMFFGSRHFVPIAIYGPSCVREMNKGRRRRQRTGVGGGDGGGYDMAVFRCWRGNSHGLINDGYLHFLEDSRV